MNRTVNQLMHEKYAEKTGKGFYYRQRKGYTFEYFLDWCDRSPYSQNDYDIQNGNWQRFYLPLPNRRLVILKCAPLITGLKIVILG